MSRRRRRPSGDYLRPPAGGAVAMLMSLLGGLALAAAAAPWDVWPLAFVGVALCTIAARGRTLRASFALGVVSGAAYYVVHIWWITIYLGPVPLLGLAALMAAWFGLGAMGAALAWRLLERGPGLLVASTASVALGAIWTARESLASSIPWGGFPWGRLAHSQADSPIGDLIGWLGMPGLSFVVATIGAAAAVAAAYERQVQIRAAVVPAAAAALALLAPPVPTATIGELRVGAVQGDSEAGLLAPYVPGEILAQHAAASRMLAGESMDVLVWPENAGEVDPQRDADASDTLDDVQQLVDAPIIVGAVTTTPDATYNSLLLWDAGVRDDYRKRRPVPFAEYLPAREVLAPILDALGFLDLIPRDYAIDPTSTNAFDVAGTTAGLFICFDIVDDGLLREAVLGSGATILLSPSNNADFGEGSAQSVQQLAIARLRAMESGRALVLVSTVGTSAVVLPDGSILDRLETYEPGVLLETLPLSDTVTPGIALGRGIEVALLTIAVLAATSGGLQALGSRRVTAPRSWMRTSPATRWRPASTLL